jgi:hypothetical protein
MKISSSIKDGETLDLEQGLALFEINNRAANKIGDFDYRCLNKHVRLRVFQNRELRIILKEEVTEGWRSNLFSSPNIPR